MKTMMNRIKHLSTACLVAAGFVIAGCETNSHYSKDEYNYDSDPGYSETDSKSNSRYRADQPPPPQARQAKEGELTEEYQMVSPGQMVVDPK